MTRSDSLVLANLFSVQDLSCSVFTGIHSLIVLIVFCKMALFYFIHYN
jgi:hypothetical protein